MKYDKLIIFSWHAFDPRVNLLFNLEYLVLNNVSVEYWDTYKLTHVKGPNPQYIEGIKRIEVKNIEDLSDKLQSVDAERTLILSNINYCSSTYSIYRLLSKYNCRIAYCISGQLPSMYRNPLRIFLGNLIYYYLDPRRAKANFHRWILHTSKFKPADYILDTCKLSTCDYKKGTNTRYIKINSNDFQIAKKRKNMVVDGKYIVFIDQCLPNHPDLSLIGLKEMDKDKYYTRLNELFDSIEKRYDCDVVIAAHPVSTDYKTQNPFNGRKCYWGCTDSLVYYSSGVITHYSTANSFIALYNKPAIIAVSDEMKLLRKAAYRISIAFHEQLGWPIYNIDDSVCDCHFDSVDEKKYNEYKYNYLTNKDSEEYSNGMILLRLLNGDFD